MLDLDVVKIFETETYLIGYERNIFKLSKRDYSFQIVPFAFLITLDNTKKK